ncbi:MAG: replication fork protection component swi3 [Lasallia pustulata]|uniref:Chromosome segregation in meiosis protein n=1 Tax=Lasallia pustulata TaxID=136370 RepID=A0A5M8PVV8_9LECA|nr:MAG: replication fork protection component swi3 [Lasallia pustulata]
MRSSFQHAAAQQTERPDNAAPPPRDDLDDLFDYDVDLGDVFGDVDTNMDVPVKQTSSPRAGVKEKSTGLGIDEEIKIAKKRRPVVKLDEHRLLSQAGIPKLRRLARERLKFKGKGHEYTDVARLLSFYQLWLDDLFPRAKFADGLTIIEKLGHAKRMQTMRREWIDEGKPKDRYADGPTVNGQVTNQQEPELQPRPSESKVDSSGPPNIDGTLRSGFTSTCGPEEPDSVSSQSLQGPKKGIDAVGDESLFISNDEGEDQPADDDLDALLAEDVTKNAVREATAAVKAVAAAGDFNDEMEVMAGMEDMW